MSNTKINANDAWKKLFDKYNIKERINKEGYFLIESKDIKEFKEPRIMAKWDSSESLPKILKKNNISILPDSRHSYILSDFKLYEKIPELTEDITKIQHIELPEYESLNINDITTESKAINVLLLTHIIDDFLEKENERIEDNYVETFHGRMGTNKFDYNIDRYRGESLKVNVDKAQCEIDAGLENSKYIVIIEAKNVIYPDFNIRQLYYPYRLWKSKVKKPIRLVFSIYSNQIYRLFEYEFTDLFNYSSIKLINKKNYSLQDTSINYDELEEVYLNTKILTDDNMNNSVPFIQADSFERVISLLEILSEEGKTKEEIAEIMQFDERQSDYYFNAGKYLGLFEKKKELDKEQEGNYIVKMNVTKLGKNIIKLNYKERQLKFVSLMLEHRIFNELFLYTYNNGDLPTKDMVISIMNKYNICKNRQTRARRSKSVISWLRWIINLTKV